MGPTWGPSGADMTQVGLMLAPSTLLSGILLSQVDYIIFILLLSAAGISLDKHCDLLLGKTGKKTLREFAQIWLTWFDFNPSRYN